MTTKLERIRKAARAAFTEQEREPWEQAWSRVFDALPDYCEDTNELRIAMLEHAMNGTPIEEAERLVMARGCAVPACPVPPPAAIPPCPV